jgi:hypothetical protein
MGNNNSLAHRYGKKGLIILAGIWVFIFLAAAGETIYTYISVPAHHRTRANLHVAQQSLIQTRKQLGQVEAWGQCLTEYTGYLSAKYQPLGPIEYPNVLAKCSDPR